MGADISQRGVVNVAAKGPEGSRAVYYERIGGRRVLLGERRLGSPDDSLLRKATVWRCDRLVRTFETDIFAPDGSRYAASFSLRTPSCRDRFALSLPRRVTRGRSVNVAIRDTFGTGGVRPRLCIAPPGGRARCRAVPLKAGQTVARRRLRASREGTWRVRLRLGSAKPLRKMVVGARGAPRRPPPAPLVLVTGDSTIQGVDGYLADRLGAAARVVTRGRPGTGISKPGPVSWLKASRIQSSTLKPRATVVSVGANDNYAVRTPQGRRLECCGQEWLGEYARRARIMMRTWSRFGGRVVWMTLPAPGPAVLRPQFSAVNTAVAVAAEGLPRATLARVDRAVSPGWTYRPFGVRNGKRVRLYLSDGLHLSPAGTSIAAGAVADQLRRTRTVRGAPGD